ncbi:hypothetical protein [Nocardioides bizhenqiangii]|uniref:GAF domain-containing protein n=1 Tax=Nocardioides bizhenqiangii TaxID=3095076 RepID=A0ABZ0ZR71_9ACTN|nr:hypothetical protein [Nocardioides sp. HM61]WQQ26580.1 hypothetical protein SHK19_21820 [Nocardioides sp. HM61]
MSARLAWVLAGLTLAFVIGDVAVTAAYRPLFSEAAVAEHGFPFTPLAVLGSALMGAVILTRYEGHAVGMLLNLVGVVSAASLLTEAYHLWVLEAGGPGPMGAAAVAGWISSLTSGQVAFAGLTVMFLVAPDGHFLSPRWRWVGGLVLAGLVLCTLVLLSIEPTSFRLRDSDIGAVRGPVFTIGFALIGFGLIAALVSMGVRIRRSAGEERQQLRLIALAVAALVAGLANSLVVQSLNGGRQTWAASLPLFIAYVLLPLAFAVAALRYRLYDIAVVINRTVVLAVGFAFAGIGYTAVVVLVGRLVDTRTGDLWLSLLATAGVAFAFQPLRRGVIRVANRAAYGSRAVPYEALSSFSRQLGDTPSATELLPAVAEAAGRAVAARRTVATLLGVDGAVVDSSSWGGEGRDPATVGHVVPVRSEGSLLGTIQVDVLRARPLRASDERLLAALADQAAVAFRNAALEAQLAEKVAELDRTTRDLAESRSRIVESDVVVRRDLEEAISHRVLPRLVALPEQLRSARVAVASGDPAHGLDALVAGTNEALEALRELTRGVFPTQLARVGIAPTLRTFLARADPAPTLNIVEPVASRRFPDRVETAVYFSSVEATRLGAASIALRAEGDDLVVEIEGLAAREVDLRAVVDRVEATGGSMSTVDGGLELRIPAAEPARTAPV